MRKKSLIVSLETTSAYLGVGLYEFPLADGTTIRPLEVFYERLESKQSDHLFSVLSRLLKKARRHKKDMGLLCVDVGPGSFTGVRVGVASARAMAQALKIPVVGVSSLEAIAWPVQTGGDKSLVISLWPALAEESYLAMYEKWASGACLERIPPMWEPNDSILGRIKKAASKLSSFNDVIIAGGWNPSLEDKLKTGGAWQRVSTPGPHPQAIAQIGATRFLSQSSSRKFSYDQVKPCYLQPSWAERKHRMPQQKVKRSFS